MAPVFRGFPSCCPGSHRTLAIGWRAPGIQGDCTQPLPGCSDLLLLAPSRVPTREGDTGTEGSLPWPPAVGFPRGPHSRPGSQEAGLTPTPGERLAVTHRCTGQEATVRFPGSRTPGAPVCAGDSGGAGPSPQPWPSPAARSPPSLGAEKAHYDITGRNCCWPGRRPGHKGRIVMQMTGRGGSCDSQPLTPTPRLPGVWASGSPSSGPNWGSLSQAGRGPLPGPSQTPAHRTKGPSGDDQGDPSGHRSDRTRHTGICL